MIELRSHVEPYDVQMRTSPNCDCDTRSPCASDCNRTIWQRERIVGNRPPGECAINALPAGYEVSENTNTGLPLLKKKK